MPGPGLVDGDRLRYRPGFTVTEISVMGSVMDDGIRVPELHDGMGCFATPGGGYTLVRNHEISEVDRSLSVSMAYDPVYRGGTTTVELDKDLNLRRHYLSLTGTAKNCSGGVMPWGSWLSCEEKFISQDGIRHGYVFEVQATHPNLAPRPIPAMGRFEHEACGWHGPTGHIYMTEDRDDGNLYRFIPRTPGKLANGGTLEALRINDKTSHNRWYCDWVTIDEPDPEQDTVRYQAQEKGAARFRRPEGLWVADHEIYFTCTAGGQGGYGEIFRFIPNSPEGGHIEQVFESSATQILQPDAMVGLPGGGLLICEDSDAELQRIFCLSVDGRMSIFAEGVRCGWTGITFSPDNSVLFVNQQYLGRTLGFTGDWSLLAGATGQA